MEYIKSQIFDWWHLQVGTGVGGGLNMAGKIEGGCGGGAGSSKERHCSRLLRRRNSDTTRLSRCLNKNCSRGQCKQKPKILLFFFLNPAFHQQYIPINKTQTPFLGGYDFHNISFLIKSNSQIYCNMLTCLLFWSKNSSLRRDAPPLPRDALKTMQPDFHRWNRFHL